MSTPASDGEVSQFTAIARTAFLGHPFLIKTSDWVPQDQNSASKEIALCLPNRPQDREKPVAGY